MIYKETVYKIVSLIPKGRVLTYGSLAKLSGAKSPRIVGNLLHNNTEPKRIPCHRVVNSKGEVATKYAFGGAAAQITKLQKEGVTVGDKTVDLDKYLWRPNKILYWQTRCAEL